MQCILSMSAVIFSLLLTAAASHAALIEGQFSGIITRAGAPFAGRGGEAFVGVPVGASVGIVIIDGTPGIGADFFGVVNLSSSLGYPALGLSSAGGLFASEALSVMNGRVFSDFGSSGLVASSPGPSSLPSGTVTAWSQTPEPTTGVLLARGLIGLGATRRR